jgi:CHAD domain-containing protein
MSSSYLTFKYFDLQRKAFERNYPILQVISETEAIHDLRVCLKKLRTLFSLFGYIAPTKFNSKQNFKPFRQLFREVGIIRDLQVQQIETKTMAGESLLDCRLYLDFLSQTEHRARQKLDHWLKDFTPPDWGALQRTLQDIVTEFGDAALRQSTLYFVTGRLTAVRKFITGIPNDETLHDTRRLLKEARFMLDMINAYFRDDPFKPDLQKSIKYAEDILGEWHDRMVGFHYLGDFIHGEKSQEHQLPPLCSGMLQQLLNEKEKLEKKALQSIKKITLVLS